MPSKKSKAETFAMTAVSPLAKTAAASTGIVQPLPIPRQTPLTIQEYIAAPMDEEHDGDDDGEEKRKYSLLLLSFVIITLYMCVNVQ